MAHKVIIIGAGYSGMSAAAYISRQGFEVEILEKSYLPGGRARMLENGGYNFDLGPSWLWMPEIFDRFFHFFGKEFNKEVKLKRINTVCRVFLNTKPPLDIPGSKAEFYSLVEQLEPQKIKKLRRLFDSSDSQYQSFKKNVIQRADNMHNCFHLTSHAIRRSTRTLRTSNIDYKFFFKDERLNAALKFPLLLQSTGFNTPANNSFAHHVMFDQGLWYPSGGMHHIAQALERVCYSQDVDISYNVDVDQLEVLLKRVNGAHVQNRNFYGTYFLSSADYFHTEQELLMGGTCNYKSEYWDKIKPGASALIYHVVLNKKTPALNHINYFANKTAFTGRKESYKKTSWPVDPEFIVAVPTKTEPGLASENQEIIKIIVPIPAPLSDAGKTREHYFSLVLDRMEENAGLRISESDIDFYKSYSQTDFINDFHALNGNVWGVSCINNNVLPFWPKYKNSKLPNLFYTGQYTFPGPGLPMALLSGEMAAGEIYHASDGRKS